MEENGSDLPSTSHFYFRRLFLGAKAKLSNGVYAESVFNFAGNDLSIDKAIIGHKFDNGVTGIVGYQKVPFGYEETTSSSKLQTIERSAINRFFADDIDFSARHMGLHAKGELDNGLSYAWALVNSMQGEGSKLGGSSNGSNDLATYVRLQWKEDKVVFGLDAGQQTNNSKTLSKDDVTAYTAYVNYRTNGINLLGEYFTGDLGADGDVNGYALRASYRKGDFEPVVRYSYAKADTFEIDSDELIRRAPKGGTVGDLPGSIDNEIDSFYVGLNYYYSKAVTLMAGYEMAESSNAAGDDAADINGFRARIQVLW
jgi:phosphate-selective porin OprO/OprP